MNIFEITEIMKSYNYQILEVFDKDEVFPEPFITFRGDKYNLINCYDILEAKKYQ